MKESPCGGSDGTNLSHQGWEHIFLLKNWVATRSRGDLRRASLLWTTHDVICIASTAVLSTGRLCMHRSCTTPTNVIIRHATLPLVAPRSFTFLANSDYLGVVAR